MNVMHLDEGLSVAYLEHGLPERVEEAIDAGICCNLTVYVTKTDVNPITSAAVRFDSSGDLNHLKGLWSVDDIEAYVWEKRLKRFKDLNEGAAQRLIYQMCGPGFPDPIEQHEYAARYKLKSMLTD